MNDLEAEMWLASRLSDHKAVWDSRGIFDSATTRDIRKERFRNAIIENGLETVIVGSREGKPQDYASTFERLFSEPLIPRVPRGTKQPTQRETQT